MRPSRVPLGASLRSLRLLATPRALQHGAELVLWGALIVVIEVVGRGLPALDIVVLGLSTVVALPVALLATAAARRGWLPLSRRAAQAVARTLRRAARHAVPRYELAFRLAPGAGVLPDQPLRRLLVVLGAALSLALLAPGAPFDALSALRAGVSFLLCGALLLLLWTLLLGVLTVAFVIEAQRVGPYVAILISTLGLLAAVLLPGVIFVGAILLVGLSGALRHARRPLAPYLFCRRLPDGSVRAVRAQTLLRRVHLAAVLLLALVVTLGNAQRLFVPGMAQGAYAFTGGLGLLAAVPCLVLLTRLDLHFGRLLSLRAEPPETPLVPTLWWDGPPPVPARVAEAGRQGWEVLAGGSPTPDDFDLVAGPRAPDLRPRSAGRRAADEDATPSERAFALRRRFHVVHRRAFVRRLHALVKETRPHARHAGTGFLFCPQTWLIPSLLRDAGTGVVPVGPLYAAVFRPRSRRYIGQLLRLLEIDVLYWEDEVSWRDLRAVLGVLFELYDQERAPALERHFIGLPRVRVVLHADDGNPNAPAPPRVGRLRVPVGSGARVLAVLRDRGADDVEAPQDSPAGRRKTPVGGGRP